MVVEEYPEPVRVVVVPTGPEVGFRVIVAIVTVNVADAVLALASVAVTVLAPDVEAGTTNVAEKSPVTDEVTVGGTVVCVTPLKVIVIVEEAAKAVPETVTVVPTGPDVGLTVRLKTLTLVVAELPWLLLSPE
ncbi:MAG: hypothetical protein OK438_00500 [Thaumarchaeota archaeon]|nr:hypothetical protein [Nitrososphaerota archaeon]